MKLHQLLRIIHNGINIVLFNMQGIEVLHVRDKESISTDLYDYDVSEVSIGWKNTQQKEIALYIVLVM